MGIRGNLVSEAGHSRVPGDTGFKDLTNIGMALKRRLFTPKVSNKWSWMAANSGRRQVRYRNTTRIEIVSQTKMRNLPFPRNLSKLSFSRKVQERINGYIGHESQEASSHLKGGMKDEID